MSRFSESIYKLLGRGYGAHFGPNNVGYKGESIK